MRMHGVDSRRGHVGQGRRRRGRLMMIVMMMNAAPWVESISALEDARRWRGWHSSTQNCGAGRAAARHGAAGHGYGIVARCRRGRGGVSVVAAANLEDYLHVVAGAPSTDTLVQIVLRRGADEVVIASWKELWTSGLRCERPEGDSEVQRLVGIVADRYAPRSRIRYPTCFVLLLGDVVNNILLRLVVRRSHLVHRTYYVHLIVLERCVVLVHVDYVVRVVYSEYGIGGVPVHADRLRAVTHSGE